MQQLSRLENVRKNRNEETISVFLSFHLFCQTHKQKKVLASYEDNNKSSALKLERVREGESVTVTTSPASLASSPV